MAFSFFFFTHFWKCSQYLLPLSEHTAVSLCICSLVRGGGGGGGLLLSSSNYWNVVLSNFVVCQVTASDNLL